MLPDYSDIRALTDRQAEWYDTNGVPRYAPFAPRLLGVYDVMALLAEVECQSCHKMLLVGDGQGSYGFVGVGSENITVVVNKIDAFVSDWSFGDPPRHDCPGAGETMTCESTNIVEVWQRVHLDWTRRPDLEGGSR